MLRVVAALLFAAVCLAQTMMSVAQLRSFLSSSKQLQHPDKKVAEFLRTVRLSEKLDEDTLIEIAAQGMGKRTMEAVNALAAASKDLPAPAPVAPKPKPQTIPPPPAEEQSKVLEEARQYALEYTRNLPNFICTQVTRRYVDPSGLEYFRLEDTIVARLSYDGKSEDYRVVLVNNSVVDTTMERVGGATSRGEFGTMMKELFGPKTRTRFEWLRWGTLRGRRMHVFSYSVDREYSDWHLIYDRIDEYVPAYRGLVYVEQGANAVMRITQEAVDLPSSFPIAQASVVLDYDAVDIGGQPHIVPLRSVMRMKTGKVMTKNDVEFRFYKKFGAEATITVTPEPLPEDETTDPAAPKQP